MPGSRPRRPPRRRVERASPECRQPRKQGNLPDTAQILVYDINADGLPDIAVSSAHDYGVFWYEQVAKGRRLPGRGMSSMTPGPRPQPRAADIDDDGDFLDLITGKRFMAHQPAAIRVNTSRWAYTGTSWRAGRSRFGRSTSFHLARASGRG